MLICPCSSVFSAFSVYKKSVSRRFSENFRVFGQGLVKRCLGGQVGPVETLSQGRASGLGVRSSDVWKLRKFRNCYFPFCSKTLPMKFNALNFM